MGMTVQAEVLIDGEAQGEVLRLDASISFWGGVNPVSSEITLAGHPQHGEKIRDKMLVIPRLIGSSSSSAIMLELIHAGVAPKALILGERDAILPIGVVVSKQMSWGTIPVVVVSNPPFQTSEVLSIADGGAISYTATTST